MNDEQEQVWNRLKHVPRPPSAADKMWIDAIAKLKQHDAISNATFKRLMLGEYTHEQK